MNKTTSRKCSCYPYTGKVPDDWNHSVGCIARMVDLEDRVTELEKHLTKIVNDILKLSNYIEFK